MICVTDVSLLLHIADASASSLKVMPHLRPIIIERRFAGILGSFPLLAMTESDLPFILDTLMFLWLSTTFPNCLQHPLTSDIVVSIEHVDVDVAKNASQLRYVYRIPVHIHDEMLHMTQQAFSMNAGFL